MRRRRSSTPRTAQIDDGQHSILVSLAPIGTSDTNRAASQRDPGLWLTTLCQEVELTDLDLERGTELTFNFRNPGYHPETGGVHHAHPL